jgi:hypothetical protein
MKKLMLILAITGSCFAMDRPLVMPQQPILLVVAMQAAAGNNLAVSAEKREVYVKKPQHKIMPKQQKHTTKSKQGRKKINQPRKGF